ncbi:MAG: hypothetical protein AABY83_09765 [Pseudomonadota bacterium]
MQHAFLTLLWVVGSYAAQTWAEPANTIAQIMAGKSAPPGVVFEVATAQNAALERLLPALQRDIQTLRTRFPALPIVVVSHGDEQFSLTTAQAPQFGAMQARIHALIANQQVKVQVCGNYARMNGVDKSQFPAAVEVVEQGPEAVREYIARGFRHVRVR